MRQNHCNPKHRRGISAYRQESALCIDADPQANLTMALGYQQPDELELTLSVAMKEIILGQSRKNAVNALNVKYAKDSPPPTSEKKYILTF